VQYYHAQLYSNGIWTVPKGKAAFAEFDELRAFVGAIDD
jgi:hypothetical protein